MPPRGEFGVRKLDWLRARFWQSPQFAHEQWWRRTQSNRFAQTEPISRRVAQAFDLAGLTNTSGCPVLRVFCEGRVPRRSAAAELGHSIAERNLRPLLVHAHRSGFVQEIETITAPGPLLRCD